MNKDMRDQLSRIKQAWNDHNDVDKFDDIYISEVARIISDSEDDVRETLEESRKFMNTPDASSNLATQTANNVSGTGEGQESEKCSDTADKEENVTDAEATIIHDIRMRKVDTEAKPIEKN